MGEGEPALSRAVLYALFACLVGAVVASGAAALEEPTPPAPTPAQAPAPAPPPTPPTTAPVPAPAVVPVPTPVPAPSASPGDWRPPAHETDPKRAKDWVLFKSGELVRGRIKQIRDEKVYFDSDQFEDIDLDWSDVAAFGSPKFDTYRFGDETIVTGTAEMRGGIRYLERDDLGERSPAP